jgi:tetratricopeptide (TPR) repeat protein
VKHRAGTTVLLILWSAGCHVTAPERLQPPQLRLAEEALLREQYAAAASHYEAFLREHPQDARRAEVLLQAGKCRAGAGQPDAALAHFDAGLAARPDGVLLRELQFRKAVALRLHGDPVQAANLFRLVAQSPAGERSRAFSSDELHWEFSMALFRAGDFKGGQAELSKVNPRGPYERQVLSRLGLAGFTVQVGAFADRAAAESLAARLKGTLRPVVLDRITYLVLSGLFSRYDEAVLEMDRLRRLGHPEAFVLP